MMQRQGGAKPKRNEMMNKLISVSLTLMLLSSLSLVAQVSPWGTGLINNQNLGPLVDTSVVFPSNSNYFHASSEISSVLEGLYKVLSDENAFSPQRLKNNLKKLKVLEN